MEKIKELLGAIETHAVEKIRQLLASDIDPNGTYQGKTIFNYLISMYTRSPAFSDCVRAFVDHGLEFDDDLLLAVLLDDAAALERQLQAQSDLVSKRYTLDTAYTPFDEVSLLHICAEFNLTACAKVLVKNGLDVNVKAGVDDHGFGGQTPIFHTVNQNGNQSKDMLLYLLAQGADLSITVQGLVWGKGKEWETLIPSVNPISYAMMGLLPQMHRNVQVISGVVNLLMRHAYGLDYAPRNIPNEYLS